MLRLTDEVPGNDIRIGVLVRDDHAFRRAGKHVDANTPVKDPLGLRNELVTRTRQNLRGRRAKQTERHRCNGLDPTHIEDRVRTAYIEGVGNCRVNADTRTRRAAAGDVFDAGHFRRGYRHNGRRDMAVPTAGRIAPSRRHRNMTLAGNKPRNDFHLGIDHRVTLLLSKTLHVVMGEPDVVFQFLTDFVRRCLTLGLGDNDVAIPLVELLGIGAGGIVTTGFNLIQDGLYRVTDIRFPSA